MQTHIGIVGLGNAGSAMATALSGKMPLIGMGHLDYASLATLWEQWTEVRFCTTEPHADRR